MAPDNLKVWEVLLTHPDVAGSSGVALVTAGTREDVLRLVQVDLDEHPGGTVIDEREVTAHEVGPGTRTEYPPTGSPLLVAVRQATASELASDRDGVWAARGAARIVVLDENGDDDWPAAWAAG